MVGSDDRLSQVAAFAIGGGRDVALARATLQSIHDVSYLRDVMGAWKEWSSAQGQPSPLFNWVFIFNFNSGPDTHSLALEVAQTAQALMFLRGGHIVRCDSGARPPLVYIGFLEVAPWNRQSNPERRYRGLGPVMTGIAGDLSVQQGYGGRVGLHSVSSAEAFYSGAGFASRDCPNEFNELYFEIGPSAARTLFQDRG